ncbi:MAG: LysR family transcriptional regulator [Pseudomonadota bacterium]
MTSDSRHIRITERVSTRLKLKQVRLLVAIDRHASILHAAREMNISQPAATKMVKDLEADFGVSLFERTNRGVVPTDHGAALVRHGKLILAQIAQAAQELDDLSEGAGGRVVVGTLLAASVSLVPEAIGRLYVERPKVSVDVREGTNAMLMPALRLGDVDMVVGRLPEYRHREEIIQEGLYEEQIRVVVRPEHELANTGEVSMETLAGRAWILPPPDTTLRRQMDKEFFDHGLEPPAQSVDSVSFLTNRALLFGTDFIGAFPYHVVETEIRHGALTALPCVLNRITIPVGVSYRRQGRLSPAANVFLDHIRAGAAALRGRPDYQESFVS